MSKQETINQRAKTGLILLMLAMLIFPAGAVGTASDQTEFKKGLKLTFTPQNPIGLGVYEIQFVPECNGLLTITSNIDRVDILSSCRTRNLNVQFIVPNGMAIYQTKTAYNQGAYQQRILQKRLSQTTDEKYVLILTKPEALGRFLFGDDKTFRDDDVVIEDAGDQSIKANIKMMDAETIRQKDIEIYDSLQNINLTDIDRTMYANLQRRAKNLGLEGIEKKLYILRNELNTILNRIIGGT